MTSLTWVVQNGDIDALKNTDVDTNETINGQTLLHIAADYGQLDIIKYLVEEKNADVNAENMYGISVLLTAIFESEGQSCKSRYKDCIRYLIEKNAKKDGKAPDGKSYADCTEDDEIKQLLK